MGQALSEIRPARFEVARWMSDVFGATVVEAAFASPKHDQVTSEPAG